MTTVVGGDGRSTGATDALVVTVGCGRGGAMYPELSIFFATGAIIVYKRQTTVNC